MVSRLHEALVALFVNRPELAPELLRASGHLQVPRWNVARRESGELTQLAPTEYRADFVVVLGEGASRTAVVVEVQLGTDPAKRASWPVYIVTLRARLGCDVVLLVVAPSPAVARWAREPIEMGHPGFCLVPLVVSPATTPAIEDAEQARASPELAVLSAMLHGKGDVERAVLVAKAAIDACASLDVDRASLYTDLVVGGLGEAARLALEAMMIPEKYEFQSEIVRKWLAKGKAEGLVEGKAEGLVEGKAEGLVEGKAEGLVEGKANALLLLLAARGLPTSQSERERIGAERDLARLDAWIARAVRVVTVAELFDDDGPPRMAGAATSTRPKVA